MENPFQELADLISMAQDYVGKDKSEEAKKLNSKLICWEKILRSCLTNYKEEILKSENLEIE